MIEITQSHALFGAVICFCFSITLWIDAKLQERAHHKHVSC